MTTEQKFHAAVNVIRSLPKNGSYQPSNELMLRFYGLFKQATLGPCDGSRPPFWDLVGRAKYDAYKSLGKMPKQDAMKKYVDELHSIVETMSYSDTVANFLEAPTEEMEININLDDLELIAGDVMERVRSQSNSPYISRDASPNRSNIIPSSAVMNGTSNDSDYSDDEYIDSVELPEPRRHLTNGYSNHEQSVYMNGTIPNRDHKSRAKSKVSNSVDVTEEILQTVESLRLDMERIINQMSVIENTSKTNVAVKSRPGIFNNFSPHVIAFIIAWPFIASLIMHKFLYRK